MKIVLIVPDGVGVRNYIYSSFIEELQNRGAEIMIYHQISDAAILEIKNVQKNIKIYQKLPVFIEKPIARIIRESIAYARLLRNKRILQNDTIMSFWNKNPKGLKLKLTYFCSEILGYFFSKSNNIVLLFENIYEKSVAKSSIIKTIESDISSFNPDFILNLHQRAPVSAPIISVANKLKIKTATVIFSWDNIPKARLVSRYDTYFVWSDLMKTELKLLYPEIDNKQIQVVGTPQFEFYFKKEFQKTKTNFYQENGLNISKKTICFSSNDQTSPYESHYFEDICEEVNKLDSSIRPQIVFRRNPVDKSNRFDEVLFKYKNLVYVIDPDWRTEKNANSYFTAIYPAYNDVQLLTNTVLHCDLVVNFGSTMAHDFSVLDKPCFYLNYNPVSNSIYQVADVYEFQHFKSMVGLDAVGWLNSKSEIGVKIMEALDFPDKIAKDRVKWMQKIVNHPLQKNSEKIAESIFKLINN